MNHFGLRDLWKSEGSCYALRCCVGLCAGSCEFFFWSRRRMEDSSREGNTKNLTGLPLSWGLVNPYVGTEVFKDWVLNIKYPSLLNFHWFWQLQHFVPFSTAWAHAESAGSTWSWTLLSNLVCHLVSCQCCAGLCSVNTNTEMLLYKVQIKIAHGTRSGGFIFGEWGFVSEFYKKV